MRNTGQLAWGDKDLPDALHYPTTSVYHCYEGTGLRALSPALMAPVNTVDTLTKSPQKGAVERI